jgi:hypothetical protein
MGRIQQYGMDLVVISLIVVAVPGLIYNNFANSNLAEASAPDLTCPGYPNVTCQGSVNVGCQATSPNSTPCDLNGSSISFLNGQSPFTQVLQGNIFALFTDLNGVGDQGPGAQTTLSGTHGPFDVAQGGTYYQTNAYGENSTKGGSQINWGIESLTQTFTDNSNVTRAEAATWNNWNTAQSDFSGKAQFFQLTGNASYVFSCNWLAQINYTALSNGPGFTYFGCDLVNGAGSGIITDPTWSVLVAMPVNIGVVKADPGVSTHQYLYAQLENWDTYECAGAQSASATVRDFQSAQCTSFLASFKGINLPGTSVDFVPSVSAASLGFFAGIMLFLLGLGFQFGFGGGVSTGVNKQGTKLAQVMGLGLIAWSFLYSEFAVWFTSGILPYGLDGATGIVSIVASGIFFTGVYGWATRA